MVTIPLPPGVEPAVPRLSATLVVVRDAPEGLQALLLKRAERGDQNSGAWVFPGGLLDEADRSAHGYFEASADALVSERLSLPSGGLDYYVAALRECFEEAGLLLAADMVIHGTTGDTLRDWRGQLQNGKATFAQLCDAFGIRLASSQLHFISHWITPLEMPKRFDSRFFLSQAPNGQTVEHDGSEMVDHCWVSPANVLSETPAVRVMGPARSIMQQLGAFQSAAAALAWARSLKEIKPIMPRLVKDEHGRVRPVISSGDS